MDEREERWIFGKLTKSKRRPMTLKDLKKAPAERGLYAIACEGVVPYLYVGQARERADEWGPRGRLEKHHTSSGGPDGDNLAGYLLADKCLAEYLGDATLLESSDKRREFFDSKCEYQAVGLPRLTNDELDAAEVYAIGRCRPRLNIDDNPEPDKRLKYPVRLQIHSGSVPWFVAGLLVAAALVYWLFCQLQPDRRRG